MTNRLAELEKLLANSRASEQRMHAQPRPRPTAPRKPQGALKLVASGAPPAKGDAAVLTRGLSGMVSRWARHPRATAHPFGAVNYTLPGVFGPIAQPKPNACWATVFAMLLSWRRQQSMTIEDALSTVGQKWVDVYTRDSGLRGDDKPAFLVAAGLIAEPPQSFSVEGWEGLLRTYGPVWITTDEAPSKPWGIHARVVIAIQGDGTAQNTYFTIVDPDGGRQYRESIATFLPKYEAEVIETGYTRVQVVHWSADARAEVRAQSMGRRSTRAVSPRVSAMAGPAIVPIVSAIAGATMTRVLNNEGDITWELDQLQGLKHVAGNPANAGPDPCRDMTVPISGPRAATVRGRDEIGVDTEIAFQFNGRSLGNVQIAIVRSNDALAAGLVVKANIMDDANSYSRKSAATTFAAIKVRIHYRFTFTAAGDFIFIDDITLFGDGTHSFTRRRTQ